MIKAKTNHGEATVTTYVGYMGTVCISFKLDIGGSFGGWALADILNHTYHELLLDGGSNVVCLNILEVIADLKKSA